MSPVWTVTSRDRRERRAAIQLPIIKNSLDAIAAAIDSATPGSFQIVECGTFSRKKPDGD